MRASSDSFARLNAVAETQQGYFTARQAVESGYADNTHPYHVRASNWIRHCRGVYRLTHFPLPEDGEMAGWYLWSQNRAGEPQGVYSHQTALSIHELSDVMPARLHLTVPPNFRRNSAIPKVLVLHRAALAERDVQTLRGFRVTRPFPTVVTLAREGALAHELVEQALDEGLRRGLILRQDIKPAKADALLPDWFGDLLQRCAA